jgi:oligopeptide/dipeptide ABC transporter ATP-binding protein
MAEEILLSARGLTKAYTLGKSSLPWVRNETFNAVDGVDLTIVKGRTLAVVGESGSGKSTLGRLLLRLIEATAGEVDYGGSNLFAMSGRALRAQRRRMQIVFQDPYGSLDPYIPVGKTIEEPLQVYSLGDAAARRARVSELLTQVGLDAESAARYPHEFSGGQRQRISIARALALSPEFIVCDEPVSALDVSVQAQIINLLLDLQDNLGLTYLFISHDLGVVRQMADEVAVMYRGRIVEIGAKQRIYSAPAHPYTQALLAAMPSYDFATAPKPVAIRGEIGGPDDSKGGCSFCARCPLAGAVCGEVAPKLTDIDSDHAVACHAVAT